MARYHGTISIKSNFKGHYYYTTVEANSLEEAKEIAKKEFINKRSKPLVILDIDLQEITQ